jgi:hypothetical protein
VSVSGLDNLVEQLRDLVVLNQKIQEQQHEDLIEGFKQIVEAVNTADGIDMSVLEAQLASINKQLAIGPDRPSYQFDIERDGRKLMKRVLVTPIPRILN